MQVKNRLPRIDRLEPIEAHEDENAHLWAISYSDFLMALLSFFILFFSLDDNKKSELVITLSEEFSKSGAKLIDKNNPSGSTEVSGERTLSSKDQIKKEKYSSKDFAVFLKDMNVQVKSEKETLVIDFPSNYFENGRYQIVGPQELLMTKVLSQLKPYQENLSLYFEGHTDDVPMYTKKQGIIFDNFLLSSLRASSALFQAKQMGFQEKHMFIQAASSNIRNTRSLSLRIVPHLPEEL